MSFASHITRTPHAFQPEIAAEAEARFADAPDLLRQLMAGAAGCSPYLAGLMAKEEAWIKDLATRDAQEMADEVLQAVRAAPAAQLSEAFRQAKRRMALLAGLADLGGVWRLEQVTGALSDLADACVDHGLKTLVAAEIARGKLPGMVADDAKDAAGMAVLAMGTRRATPPTPIWRRAPLSCA